MLHFALGLREKNSMSITESNHEDYGPYTLSSDIRVRENPKEKAKHSQVGWCTQEAVAGGLWNLKPAWAT